MRHFPSALCLLLLVGCRIVPETSREVDAFKSRSYLYSLTFEQIAAGDNPTPAPDDNTAGKPCVHDADPNFPCPCQGDLAACKHKPRCRAESGRGQVQKLEEELKATANALEILRDSQSKMQVELEAAQFLTKKQAETIVGLQATQTAAQIKESLQKLIPDTAGENPLTFEQWKSTLPPLCLIYISRKNCPPCREQESVVLAGMVRAHWPTIYVNADTGPVAEWLNATSTPTIIGWQDGKEVGRLTGLTAPVEAAASSIPLWFTK